MQKGIKLDFSSNKITFDFSTPIEDFAAVAQNALIDTLTFLGSDTTYPDRGTEFQEKAWKAIITNSKEVQHEANFAAIDVKDFINQNIMATAKDNSITEDTLFNANTASNIYSNLDASLIKDYTLTPVYTKDAKLILRAIFTSTKNEKIGIETILTNF